MENRFTAEDRDAIRKGIMQKYAKVAASPEGNFRYPTGIAGLEALRYDPQILKALPEDVLGYYCGVGNPFSLGPIHDGESVLDVGCGAGVDALVAAIKVGEKGRAFGVDLSPQMLERARSNLEKTKFRSVSFFEASGEALPFSESSFDVVISNGAFNLIPDKLRALQEVLRVLQSGGRLMIADQFLTVPPPHEPGAMIKNWAR